VQTISPIVETPPVGQSLHASAPEPEYFPATHFIHVLAEEAPVAAE
jgi:hypothetical protein